MDLSTDANMKTGQELRVVLTGHSRGLGAAIAQELLSRNIPVLGLSRTRHQELALGFPDLLKQVELDLSASDRLIQWLETGAMRAFLAHGAMALLINNVGSIGPMGPSGTLDGAALVRSVMLNAAVSMVLTNELIAATSVGVERRVLHISSGAGAHPIPGWSTYCATKAALDHHARTVAIDNLPDFRISSIDPGVIDTDMQAEIRASSPEQFPLRDRFIGMKQDNQLPGSKVVAEKLVKHLLSQRFGQDVVIKLRDIFED